MIGTRVPSVDVINKTRQSPVAGQRQQARQVLGKKGLEGYAGVEIVSIANAMWPMPSMQCATGKTGGTLFNIWQEVTTLRLVAGYSLASPLFLPDEDRLANKVTGRTGLIRNTDSEISCQCLQAGLAG